MEKTIVVIKGDGIGRTKNGVLGVTDSAIKIVNAAVEKAYQGTTKLNWVEALAGEYARETNFPNLTDEELKKMTPEEQRSVYLPQTTIDLIKEHKIAIKGPLGTPIGEGFKSLNVYMRQLFDLYSCVRPVRYFHGAPSPNINAEKINMVIFRENVEDVYAGIEFEAGSAKQKKLLEFLVKELGANLDPNTDYGLGIKPMSAKGTKRLVRNAINYALEHKYKSVTIVHKGNIMKYTEGAFRKWAYEVAKEEFGDKIVLESELSGQNLEGKLIIKDRIADAMLQLVQQRPEDYGVLACPNLNGDYLSDDLAALIGGLGLAPGANIGDKYAIFEATHGTAPTLPPDKANPSSVTLSAAMLLDHIGLTEAADLVRKGIEKAVSEGAKAAGEGKKPLPLTGDLASQYKGYTGSDGINCSEYVDKVINYLGE
ncbi:NADP-dependent isocitrate dehydrogenase [Candidatus Woesearchaeota archaeon]|nr:NADP-dependent isocitrate dehydrogenase [Candidatus Woesearchaeota archaeon]